MCVTSSTTPILNQNLEQLNDLNSIITDTAFRVLQSTTTDQERDVFTRSCQLEMNLRSQVQEAQENLNRAIKEKADETSVIDPLRRGCRDLDDRLRRAEEKTIDDAKPILDKLLATSLLSSRTTIRDNSDNVDDILIMYSLLAGSISTSSPEDIQKLLDRPRLVEEMLCYGGAKDGEYVNALKILDNIIAASQYLCHYDSDNYTNTDGKDDENQMRNSIDHHDQEVLYSLALGTALEHAVPINMFDTQTPIDPVVRYLHYEAAYLASELDPILSISHSENTKNDTNNNSTVSNIILTPWECRYITNSDAANHELTWFRTMLKNYRPDHIITSDYQWRYCQIVRSDVHYKIPDWKGSDEVMPPHRTYQKLISGGGKCGPRAWFGRLACKAFGIPTWGVRQPGHAAMSHWTPSENGWVVCLGGGSRENLHGGWHKSHWEGRNAIDFLVEAEARIASNIQANAIVQDGGGSRIQRRRLLETEYGKVLRMRWIGSAVLGERNHKDCSCRVFDLSFIWYALASIQSKILARCILKTHVTTAKTTDTTQAMRILDSRIKASVSTWTARARENVSSTVQTMTTNSDIIIIPADTCKGKSVKVIPSFNNAYGIQNQIHLNGKEVTLDYTIQVPKTGLYKLTVDVVTVHEEQKPIHVSIKSCDAMDNSLSPTHLSIDVPYTAGDWKSTNPVGVILQAGLNDLSVTKVEGKYGISLKYFSLDLIE